MQRYNKPMLQTSLQIS